MPVLAPIILFVYNRPSHTLQTLEALKNNEYADRSTLIIYCDGPKEDASEEEIRKIKEVRKIIRKSQWCSTVDVIESDTNKGLAASITGGVTEIINKYGKAIVLEDDLITSKYFLKFMNNSLDLYEFDNEVISVSGYFYPIYEKKRDTFFLQGADCWGWATWKRGWLLYNNQGQYLKERIVENRSVSKFNYGNTYPFLQMLEYQINGQNNSWAILWYASAFINNKLTLYPGKSLVHNIGNDDSGNHHSISYIFDNNVTNNDINLEKIPLIEDLSMRRKVEIFFRKKYKKSLFLRMINFTAKKFKI
jgi:hypothetical protein